MERKDTVISGYVRYLAESSLTDRVIGMRVRYANRFIETNGIPTRRAYLAWRKERAMELAQYPRMSEAVSDFMKFLRVKGGKNPVPRLKALERLDVVASKNQELINKFMAWIEDEFDYSPHTIQLHYYGIKDYFRYADNTTFDTMKRYIHSLEEHHLKPQTIRLRMLTLEKLSVFLKKPVKFKRPKIVKTLFTDNIPSEKEYNRLIDYLERHGNQEYVFWIKVLATTGARVSEFLQFTWEAIASGETTLRGKGNKYRHFFFPKSLSVEITKYAKAHGRRGLFAINRYGEGISSHGLSDNLKEWGEKCGIDRSKMHPHAFRHFFAKMYLKKNKDIIQLADLLGHGSVDTTRIYLKKSYDEQKRDFNRNVTW